MLKESLDIGVSFVDFSILGYLFNHRVVLGNIKPANIYPMDVGNTTIPVQKTTKLLKGK